MIGAFATRLWMICFGLFALHACNSAKPLKAPPSGKRAAVAFGKQKKPMHRHVPQLPETQIKEKEELKRSLVFMRVDEGVGDRKKETYSSLLVTELKNSNGKLRLSVPIFRYDKTVPKMVIKNSIDFDSSSFHFQLSVNKVDIVRNIELHPCTHFERPRHKWFILRTSNGQVHYIRGEKPSHMYVGNKDRLIVGEGKSTLELELYKKLGQIKVYNVDEATFSQFKRNFRSECQIKKKQWVGPNYLTNPEWILDPPAADKP